jgi:hypothetical protein
MAEYEVIEVTFWTTMGRVPGNRELPNFWEVRRDGYPVYMRQNAKTKDEAVEYAKSKMVDGDTLDVITDRQYTCYCD